jgi:hypothetical protein
MILIKSTASLHRMYVPYTQYTVILLTLYILRQPPLIDIFMYYLLPQGAPTQGRADRPHPPGHRARTRSVHARVVAHLLAVSALLHQRERIVVPVRRAASLCVPIQYNSHTAVGVLKSRD